MIVIIGESGSGKSTLQNAITSNPTSGIKKVVTYTTRPQRPGEVDGVDYHFVDKETFFNMRIKGEFIEVAEYRGWFYGTAKKDCRDYHDRIAVLTPSGLRRLKAAGINVFSFYLHVDRRSRLIKLLERGDDIDEACRRSLSDVGQFDGVGREVNYILSNRGYIGNVDSLVKEFFEVLEVADSANKKNKLGDCK